MRQTTRARLGARSPSLDGLALSYSIDGWHGPSGILVLAPDATDPQSRFQGVLCTLRAPSVYVSTGSTAVTLVDLGSTTLARRTAKWKAVCANFCVNIEC